MHQRITQTQVSAALDRMQSEMSSQDAEALRFPLSCGDLRPETDKSGSPCLVVDCIFNADVAAAAGHNRWVMVGMLGAQVMTQKLSADLATCALLSTAANILTYSNSRHWLVSTTRVYTGCYCS